jgi:hypothetical protein
MNAMQPRMPTCVLCEQPGLDECLRCGVPLCAEHARVHPHDALRSTRKPIAPNGPDWVACLFVEVGGRTFTVRANDNFQIIRRAGDDYDYYPVLVHAHRAPLLRVTALEGRGPWLGLLDCGLARPLPIVDGAIMFAGQRAPLSSRELLLEYGVRDVGSVAIPIDRLIGEGKPTTDELRRDHVIARGPSNALDDHALESARSLLAER